MCRKHGVCEGCQHSREGSRRNILYLKGYGPLGGMLPLDHRQPLAHLP
ncbi:unnamed protein product [Larinioides sclopetarius]|uniref:Uncharacterized protein n=1 Tax=Larinioides sclopetarius TaxID=280406 RepID=A0AAV1YUS8_9ARAC